MPVVNFVEEFPADVKGWISPAMEKEATEAVQRGADVLDRMLPGWAAPGTLNLLILNLADPCACVLGQLFGQSKGYFVSRDNTLESSLYGNALLTGYEIGIERLISFLQEQGEYNSFPNPRDTGKRYGFCGHDYPFLTLLWLEQISIRRGLTKVVEADPMPAAIAPAPAPTVQQCQHERELALI
jgi:hypothetical protein